MMRIAALAVVVALAGACAPAAAPPDAGATVRGVIPSHRAGLPSAPSTHAAIGRVVSSNPVAGTIVISVARGAQGERLGLGPRRTFSATLADRAAVAPGDVVEFRYQPGRPYPHLVAIDHHVHREPIGLPDPATVAGR